VLFVGSWLLMFVVVKRLERHTYKYPNAQAFEHAGRMLGSGIELPRSAKDIVISVDLDQNSAFTMFTIRDSADLQPFLSQFVRLKSAPAYCEPVGGPFHASWWRREMEALRGDFKDIRWLDPRGVEVAPPAVRGYALVRNRVYGYSCDRPYGEPPG